MPDIIKTIWGDIWPARLPLKAETFDTMWGSFRVSGTTIFLLSQEKNKPGYDIPTIWGVIFKDHMASLQRQRKTVVPAFRVQPKRKYRCQLCRRKTSRKILCSKCQVEIKRLSLESRRVNGLVNKKSLPGWWLPIADDKARAWEDALSSIEDVL